MANASLTPIQERLNSVDPYHPLDAKTFSDWSMEAGDIVTVKRGEEEYASPIHTTRMTWKGAPQITVQSTGSKERKAVSKVSKKKYGRGSGRQRTDAEVHRAIYSEDGILYSLVEQTASHIRTEVGIAISGMARTVIEQTATYIRTEVENAASSISRSVIEQTAEYVHTEVSHIASGVAWSVVTQTMTNIEQKIGRRARVFVQWTDPAIDHPDLIDGDLWYKKRVNQTWDEIGQETWDALEDYKWQDLTGLKHYIRKDGRWVQVYDSAQIVESRVDIEHDDEHWAVLAKQVDIDGETYRGMLSVTARQIYGHVEEVKAGVQSTIESTARKIELSVSAAKSNLAATILVTATGIYSAVHDYVAGNYSTILQTSTSIALAVSGASSALYSTILVTATGVYSAVHDYVSGNYSTITQTSTSIAMSVSAAEGRLNSTILVTSTSVYTSVKNYVSGNYSTITQTDNKIETAVSSAEGRLGSRITQTQSDITAEVSRAIDKETELEGMIIIQAGTAGLVTQLTDSRDIISFPRKKAFPQPGEPSVIYLDVSTKKYYEWNGSDYVTTTPGRTIKASSIITSINAAGESVATINADRINLNGYVKSEQLNTELFYNKIAQMQEVSVQKLTSERGGISVQSVGTTSFKQGNIDCYVPHAVTSLRIVQSGDTYTLQRKWFSEDEWHDVGNFSRATSLSSGWSSSSFPLTVTASPQGDTYTIGFGGQYGDHNRELSVDSNGNAVRASATAIRVPVKVAEQRSGNPATRYTKDLTYNIGSLLQDKTASSNGTVTPDSDYIGLKSVAVSVSPVLNGVWSGSSFPLTMTSNPAGTTYTIGFGGQYGAHTRELALETGGNATRASATAISVPVRVGEVLSSGATSARYNKSLTYNVGSLLQAKTVTENGTVTPDSSYIGLKSVEVNVAGAEITELSIWDQNNTKWSGTKTLSSTTTLTPYYKIDGVWSAGGESVTISPPASSYTRYTFSKSRTQDSSGYHYTFTIGTGWTSTFGGDGGTYYLYKKD